jgi:molybdopterin-biosynthesis enzyme MoeA-like protein
MMISKIVSQYLKHKNSKILNDQLEPVEAQEQAFLRLKSRLKGSEVYDRAKLQCAENLSDFAKISHSRTYKDYAPLIDQALLEDPNEAPLFNDDIEFVGLSSGTTSANAKKIPYNKSMIKAFKNFEASFASVIQDHFNVKLAEDKRITWGSLALVDKTEQGRSCGYVSGYLAQKSAWFIRKQAYPSAEACLIADPQAKMKELAKEARGKDIRLIAGVPAYLISLLENLKEELGVENFAEVWPNLQTCVYSATNIDGYKTQLNELLGREVNYIGCYLCTEAPLGYEIPSVTGENNGTYAFHYGDIVYSFRRLDGNSEIISLGDLKAGDEVELLISCPNGLLNYELGDCLRIKSVSPFVTFEIMGRKNHGLKVATEKVTMTELHRAIREASEQLETPIHHFFLTPSRSASDRTCYRWTLFVDEPEKLDAQKANEILDNALKVINDDYREAREELAFLDTPKIELMKREILSNYFERNSHRGQLKVRSTFDNEEDFENFFQNSFLPSQLAVA